VAQHRRPQRRQGIVYGPARQGGGGRYTDSGVLIGRFLGFGVLLLTLGVLAAGALAFVGDRPGPSATPVRSAAIGASFSFAPNALTPTDLPTQAPPTVLPTVSSAVLTPQPSLSASIAPPLVQIGKGFVTFGTESDEQLHIADPRASFALDERMVWSAYLTRPVNSADLLVRILKLDSAVETGERLILEEPVTPLVRGAQIFGRRLRPDALLDGVGIYIVRYLRDGAVLSQGSFEVTG
jgi:hypothetical protein